VADKYYEQGVHKTWRTVKAYANSRIRIAQDLFYPQKCIDRLRSAKTFEEVDRIMASARKGEYD
jgi:hypothetical protein